MTKKCGTGNEVEIDDLMVFNVGKLNKNRGLSEIVELF